MTKYADNENFKRLLLLESQGSGYFSLRRNFDGIHLTMTRVMNESHTRDRGER